MTALGTAAVDQRAPSALRPRYRDPGDVLRLIAWAFVALVVGVIALVANDRVLGERASIVRAVNATSALGRLLVGIVQLVAVASAVIALAVVLRRRRFRLLATVAAAAAVAAAVVALVGALFDDPGALHERLARSSFVASAAFPSPALFAAAAVVVVAVGPWLTRPWPRVAWLALVGCVAVRVLAGVVLPAEAVLALATGAIVGSATLVAFGVPDRRIDADRVAAALVAAGIGVDAVAPAQVRARGSQPFVARGTDGRELFVKVLGRDQRSADLLYRAYRVARVRDVGDVRPAASLKQAVEHQALVALMARAAGARVPEMLRVATTDDGSALLVMARVDGDALEGAGAVDDATLSDLWHQVALVHAAGIAHRSLRTGNVMVDREQRAWIVDFSFSELSATARQQHVDIAELLVSLAAEVGPERAASAAVAALGRPVVGDATPLVQRLALSATTRRSAPGDLIARTRRAAIDASGVTPIEPVPLARVRMRTILAIAAAAGAFYFLLPQLAHVGSSWRAFQSASWVWTPAIVAMSVLTYVGGAIGMLGSVPQPVPFGPLLATQFASSFVNRVSPANVGGMALNARFLQNCGVEPTSAVAAVGLNAVAGFIVHLSLLVVFFAWTGNSVGGALKLPSSSTLLVVIAVVAAAFGVITASRWGRRVVLRKIGRGVRSSARDLALLARRPSKLALLLGGSTLVTGAYLVALWMSVQAFGGGLGVARVGAVYLGGSALAAAAPTPGNLGAIEAAFVAGLTSVGMAAGPAVSTVLVYRLATYWLPIVPGWIAWHLLQRGRFGQGNTSSASTSRRDRVPS